MSTANQSHIKSYSVHSYFPSCTLSIGNNFLVYLFVASRAILPIYLNVFVSV